ncbi:Alpha-L-arabinofuranosidase 1 [Hordeum vulgare]|nr:Alpha-L-arabinofuranosidase 1 [Hordeum vulgare]
MVDDNGSWYDGLIEEFDRVHRGRAIENRTDVVAMRMRGHAANDFSYDVRYEPYITRLGLLPFVLQFKRNPPPVNHSALTALTDRWRPETHSFHLPFVEMTMNLEDMAMISDLPLNSDAVTGHLDQASMRTRESSSLCGFVRSLSMWMWERLPVGRPMLKNPDHPNPNPHEGLHHEDPYRRPTIAYHWDQVPTFQFLVLYVFLTAILERVPNISARPVVVDRVARQFGKRQGIPTELTSSVITSLHWYSRRNSQDIPDWAAKHQMWIAMWNQRGKLIEKEDRPHNDSAYQKYLVWYAERYRLKLKPGWTREEWSELVSEDPSVAEGYHAFNMGREFLMCVNDANVALSHPRGGASCERTLRTMLEKFKSRFHKWAAMLSCHGAQSVDVFTGGTSRSCRARHRQLTIDDIEEEEEEETTQEHEVDIDAPQPSQPS